MKGYKCSILATLLLWMVTGNLFADVTITTVDELKALRDAVKRDAVNSGTSYVGENIYLKADLDLNNEAWTPIGDATNPFMGNFEGGGHKISNLKVEGSNDYAGLFGYIDGGSVRDVGVEGSGVAGGLYVGGICGYLKSGEISSCYSNIAVSGTQYVGGLCGYSEGKIENCWHQGNVTASGASDVNAGGLVGDVNGDVNGGSLQRCFVINTAITVYDVNNNSYFGFIVGQWCGSTRFLDNCRYDNETVSMEGFKYGKDVTIGSEKNGYSPSKPTVIGATTTEMTVATAETEDEWSDILNTEKNNPVWVIEDGSYPQLNSFCKNRDITFHFTQKKKWLSIVPNGNYTDLNGVKAYIVTKADKGNNTITLRQVSTLNEGCGALVYYDTDAYGGVDVVLSHTTDAGLADYTGNLLQGSHVSPVGYVADGTQYILKNGAFVPSASGSLARNKAYLKVPAVASGSVRYDFQLEDEGVTDIQSIRDVQGGICEKDCWYTLDGKKLDGKPTEKGIYLYNEHKILIQ